MGWRSAAGGLAVAALIALAVVLVGNGHRGDHPKPAPPTPTAPRAAPPAAAKSHAKQKRRHRQAVRKGHGTRPDEPAPGTGPLLGIADQKPATFSDPLFRRLGVTRSRLNTPWNSVYTEPARLEQWLQAARGAGIEPLVAFEHNRGDQCPAKPCSLPPLSAYERAIRAFHAKYPWVHLLEPWNEANSGTQPTGKHPARAAAYYEATRRICPRCTIPAADVLDSGNLGRWLGRFRAALHGPPPQLWGLHNYTDTNRFRTSGTREMLNLVPGEIWLTEAGGIVSFQTVDGRTVLPYDENRAARATRFLFRLARLSPRITRIYIYQWKIDFPGNRFDAGLVGPSGNPRPALGVVLKHRSLLR